MSDESVKSPVESTNSLAPSLNNINNKIRVKFDRRCLKQDKSRFTHKQVVNIYTVYEIHLWPFNVGKDLVFKKSLFGRVKLIINPGLDKNKHSGYGIGFGAR